MMGLPENMKKGEYLLKGNSVARRIVRVKKCKEYGEKMYVLQGEYGTILEPRTVKELESWGFEKCVGKNELNELWREGEYIPSQGCCVISKKRKLKLKVKK